MKNLTLKTNSTVVALKPTGSKRWPVSLLASFACSEGVAIRFGFRSSIIRKGIWMHDVIEDCKLSVAALLPPVMITLGHDGACRFRR